MCFSSEASFAAGSLLLITGVSAIKKTSDKSQLMVAAIPLVFALQQFSEGLLWLAMDLPEYSEWKEELTYVFLIFAQVVWPVWVPLAFMLAEKDTRKRKLISLALICGIALGIYILACLFLYPVSSEVTSHHISYVIGYPHLHSMGVLFYFIPTVIPPFLSSLRLSWLLASLNLLTLLISKLFFKDHVISVWCFMAAIISIVILLIIIQAKKTSAKEMI